MFCKNCGRQLSDNETFCPGCGTKRPGGSGACGDERSSSDMKNLPSYAKENDLHHGGHAVDSDRKAFSLSGDPNQKKFSLSGQNKFTLSDSGKNKFSISGDSRKDTGDGIVRITTSREPAASPKAPTGFVNPLKDSGKTVFRSDSEASAPAQPEQTASAAKPAQAAPVPPPAGTDSQGTAPREPDAILDGNDGPTGFVNPLKNAEQDIHWGSDGDRNETKGGTQFAGDPRDIDSHMGFAIFVTILGCCNCLNLVLGIIAIVFASQVQKHIEEGNYEQAKKSADTARILCWISLGLMLLGFVMSFVTGAISAFLEAFSS